MKKPAYKMKKKEILMELMDEYGVTLESTSLKRDLVYALQAHRKGDCCKACGCNDDLQKINTADRPFYKQFWDMFKIWN